jgi:predicted ATPase
MNEKEKDGKNKMERKKVVYVITGGPCVGKTTILNDLKKKGFHVMHEVPRQVIEERQEHNKDYLPSDDIKEFQEKVLKTHLEIEKDLPEEVVFLDRGIGDILAYCDVYGIDPPKHVETHSKSPRYHKIILLDRLGFFENDDARKDGKIADQVHNALEAAYKRLGYEIIKVPPLPPRERLEWLMKRLGLEGKKK